MNVAPPSVLQVTAPLPVVEVVSVAGGGAAGNGAVIAESAFMVIEQEPVPVQLAFPVPPVHPLNPLPIAVNMTAVPVTNEYEQVPAPVQLMPGGFDVTVPLFTMVTDKVLKFVARCAVVAAGVTRVVPGGKAARTFGSKFGSVNGGICEALKPAGSG